MALAPSLTQRNTLAYLSKFCGCSSQVKPQCLSEVLAVMISMQTPPAGKLPMQALSEIPRCSGLQHHFPSVSSCCDMEETCPQAGLVLKSQITKNKTQRRWTSRMRRVGEKLRRQKQIQERGTVGSE